jgi:Ca2+/Na+ antiporter
LAARAEIFDVLFVGGIELLMETEMLPQFVTLAAPLVAVGLLIILLVRLVLRRR